MSISTASNDNFVWKVINRIKCDCSSKGLPCIKSSDGKFSSNSTELKYILRDYFFKLGKFNIDDSNFDRAFELLSQISVWYFGPSVF